jgi:hypothetical protein
VGAVARQLLVATAAVVCLVGCASDSSDSSDSPDSSGGPVAVEARPPAAEDRAACRALHGALPARVADQDARSVDPDSDWAAAWGDPAIVLTCGGPRAADFKRISTCTTVNDIDWFIPEEQLETDEPVELTMTTVNREPVVRVVLPAEHWPPATTLADLSEAVRTSTDRTGSCV